MDVNEVKDHILKMMGDSLDPRNIKMLSESYQNLSGYGESDEMEQARIRLVNAQAKREETIAKAERSLRLGGGLDGN